AFLRCSPLSLSTSFFFYRYVHHRDLHSFPTRRSSDLSLNASICSLRVLFSRFSSSLVNDFSIISANKRALPAIISANFLELLMRSEEHTSELQSRENLVCRLLLEKKKQNSTTY